MHHQLEPNIFSFPSPVLAECRSLDKKLPLCSCQQYKSQQDSWLRSCGDGPAVVAAFKLAYTSAKEVADCKGEFLKGSSVKQEKCWDGKATATDYVWSKVCCEVVKKGFRRWTPVANVCKNKTGSGSLC